MDRVIDMIDLYSSDRSRWPASLLPELDDALASDANVADYFAKTKAIDDALASWEENEDEDGVSTGEDQDTEADDDTDDEGDSDADDQEDTDEGDEDEGDEDEDTSGQGEADENLPGPDEAEDDQQGEPGFDEDAEMDLKEARDLDSMMEAALEQMMSGAFNDGLQIDFTKEYDVIAPYDDKDGREPNVKRIEDNVRTSVSAMQRELQRIIVAKSHCYMTPGFRRGRINSAALHRVPAGDDRVFRRKQEAISNKVAMSLVIDNSGSMSGKKIVTAMTAAWAFAETLERLKIACDVVGFTDTYLPSSVDARAFWEEVEQMAKATGCDITSIRKQPFYMPIYKGFEEKFGPAQKRRMAHLIENQGILVANNDACALDYAGRRLLARPETRKIMIVFSDGQPAGDTNYAVLNNTVKEYVKRLERNGVETIGVGIMSTSVRHFYPKNYVLNDAAELPSFVMRELKALLT